MFEPTARQDALAKTIVDAAFNVHQGLGPGLLESVYQQCLHHELSIRSIEVRTQVALPVLYKGITIPAGLRMDMVVANEVVLEIKAVEKLLPVHDAQLLTYLRLAGLKLGFLINFNVPLIKQGIKRMLNART
jgi:GxxExxY protein